MRWLIAGFALAILFAGCFDGDAPVAFDPITWMQAWELMSERADNLGDYTLSRVIMTDIASFASPNNLPAPTGLAWTWTLYFEDSSMHQRIYYVHSGGAYLVDEGPAPERNRAHQCEPISGVDSPDIATSVANSRIWAVLQEEWEPAHERLRSLHLTFFLDCWAGTTHWQVQTPFAMNQDGSTSFRTVYVSGKGTIGGFAGDSSRGYPYSISIGNGIGVTRWEGRFPLSSTETQSEVIPVPNGARLAVVIDLQPYSIAPFTSGTLRLTSPSGVNHVIPWTSGPLGNQATTAMFPDLLPTDMGSEWTAAMQVEAPGVLGSIIVWSCTGVPDSIPGQNNPACIALQDPE